MFDSLKKKLKAVIEKVSGSVREEKKEEEIAAALEPKKEEFHHSVPSQPPEDMIELQKESQEIAIEKQLERIERQEKRKKGIVHETPDEPEPVLEEAVEELAALPEAPEKKPGFLSRLIKGAAEKTITADDVDKVVKEIKIVMLEADVSLEVVDRIEEDMKRQLAGKQVGRGRVSDEIKNALRSAMLGVMKQEQIDVEARIREKDGVFTIMFLGFNGTGKTTTLAKFAKKLHKYHPVVAAADTFRAASIEQLEEHSRRAGFRLVKREYGADSAAVIFDARKSAEASGSKLVLADTAGRSHSNVNLMDELKKIVRVNRPDMKILVLDSLTGNDIYEQSMLFDNAVGVDAVVLTKADVYDKGGAALSTSYTIKKPILYLGVGQEYDDLREFRPEEVVKNLLG